MEGAEKGSEQSPLLQIDPKCFQDALRAFFQPIKTDDARVDFYKMYKREATEYDTDYVKKYDEDLNTTLIFAGLFSAVSSAFAINANSNLQPDPNTALLRAILHNQSAIPGETPAVPLVQENPASEIVIAACLMYASLMISLLAAFFAMLGKQWLNRYSRNSGGSMIERCGDRQRKCDGLEKWPLYFFVESLSVMLQVALLLLACGLCRYMWSINTPVAYTLTGLTGIGVVFYIAIVIAGMSSYACPFQTPASITLHNQWKKVRRGIVSSIVHSKRVLSWIHQMWNLRVQPLFCPQSLPTNPLESVQVQQSESVSMPDDDAQPEPSPALDNPCQSESLVKPEELSIIRRTNTSDAQCVSWILRNITDPEALDAAIRLAGEVRWFDDGVNVNPPYDLIVTTFEACFDSAGMLHPGSRDRAYYSGRAMMWIHTLAMCKPEFPNTFPLPTAEYTTPVPDPDLRHLLQATSVARDVDFYIGRLLMVDPGHTPTHSQWISNLILHYSWADQTNLHYGYILDYVSGTHETKIATPLNATLNRLLVWCIFLKLPIEEEALKVQDKSDRMEPVLNRLSKAVLSAISGTRTRRKFIPHMLRDLVKLETRPACLTKIVYEWCSVICENRESLQDWESLVLVCLEIGFRHLDFRHWSIRTTIIHTEAHRGLVDVVFKSQESEVIADLLHAWTAEGGAHEPAHPLLCLCAGHLVGLHNLVPFSPRLRRLVIRSIELIGYEGFKGVGVEGFIGLLNHLRVTAEEMDSKLRWAGLLLEAFRTSGGAQRLSHWCWESLVELAVSWSPWMEFEFAHGLQIITSLTEAKEWGKLECCMGIIWMLLPRKADEIAEGDLGHSMLLLFHQRPGAVQKLEQWMEQWSQGRGGEVPESFKRICKQAHEAAQQDAPPTSPTDKGTEGSTYTPPPSSSQPSGENDFWELLPF